MEKAREEKVIVLDFLQNGYPFDERPMHLKSPITQAVGMEHFILLELVPKPGIHLQPYEEVYIGEGKREKIHHIIGKLPYDILAPEMPYEKEKASSIVFPTGGFVVDDTLFVYYGASDYYICLATGSLSALLLELKQVSK